jgi:hypothetical protein
LATFRNDKFFTMTCHIPSLGKDVQFRGGVLTLDGQEAAEFRKYLEAGHYEGAYEENTRVTAALEVIHEQHREAAAREAARVKRMEEAEQSPFESIIGPPDAEEGARIASERSVAAVDDRARAEQEQREAERLAGSLEAPPPPKPKAAPRKRSRASRARKQAQG